MSIDECVYCVSDSAVYTRLPCCSARMIVACPTVSKRAEFIDQLRVALPEPVFDEVMEHARVLWRRAHPRANTTA
jgi:hypothetical protein